MNDTDILIYKENETYLKVESEYNHILQEISDYFTIEVPNAKYMPAYKKGWDGKLRLFNKKTKRLYLGLFSELVSFLKSTEYTFLADKTLKPNTNISKEYIDKFINSLSIPYQLRDYQYNALSIVLNQRKAVIQSSTGSGKSLIIYMIARYFEENKILIIVPTVGLTTQMYKDFADYAQNDDWTVEDNVHIVTAGVAKDSNKQILLSTWQSIYQLPKTYFQQYSTIIIDETHQAKATSIRKILENANQANVRVGLTGTLQDTQTHILTIQGLIGEIYKVSSTSELQDRDILSQIDTKMLLLQYSDEDKKQVFNMSYQEEVEFLLQHSKRNKFLYKLIGSLEGNTLVLASYVEKQGQLIYEQIKNQYSHKNVFFIYGEMLKEEREDIRQYTEKHSDVIIVATYGVFSTGINIHRLHNIIFALAGKSKIRILQSLGRGLRKHSTKDKLNLYDISDDLRWNSRKNFSFRHFEERYKQYIKEKFPITFSKIPLFPQLDISNE